MAKSVYCLAESRLQAERIIGDLRMAGFSSNDVSVLCPDRETTRDFGYEKETKAPEGATTGGVAAGIAGGVLGWLAGIGAVAIPGVGPFIAAGPIMAALGGAAIGAGTGGIVGALVGLGVPEYEAKRYEGKLESGNILIAVHTEDRDQRRLAKELLERDQARDIASSEEARV
jgi:hypothetical protein